MKLKKYLDKHIRGWLPKEPRIAYALKTSKPRWRRPRWMAFTLLVTVALAGVIYFGVNTYLRYSYPQRDITANYYEKTVNVTTVNVGDITEVRVLVGWHGYVIPEFKRNVEIVDPFPENCFALEEGTNVYNSSGYGGSYQLKYSLRAVGGEGAAMELPKPRLYIDNVEVELTGENPTVNISPHMR